ncbi:hypothetical protein Tco_1571209 [Tanacetum coccineum]
MKSSRKSTDLTANTPYYSRPIRHIQDFDESKDHCLTLKNTPLDINALALSDRHPTLHETPSDQVILLIEEIAKIAYEMIKFKQSCFTSPSLHQNYFVLCTVKRCKRRCEASPPVKGDELSRRFETYVNSKDIDFWHAIVYGDYKPTIKNKDTGNKQVKDNKIALFVKKYEEFTISDDESIDCVFARFNTIITSLKALDESFSSRNHVRKFLRALPTKWRPKVMAIEESKDLSTLPLDEIIGNLKVYEVVLEKDSKASKNKKEKYKCLALKAKKVSSDKEVFYSGSDEEYAMAVRDFNKFFRRRGKFVRQTNDDKKNLQRAKEDKKSDSEEEYDSKRDKICLMALDNNEVLFDTLFYSSSSLYSESLQNEYNKLCKISLRIINKNKLLKTKNEILDNEVYDLKKKLEHLEKSKEISIECESCVKLYSKIESLSLKLAMFENSSHFLQEMIENQRSQKYKKGPGLTDYRALTSEVKTGKIGQESGKTPTIEPEEPVPSAREPTSSNEGNRPSVEACEILDSNLIKRTSSVQITKKTLPNATIENVKQTPALNLGQGLKRSKI